MSACLGCGSPTDAEGPAPTPDHCGDCPPWTCEELREAVASGMWVNAGQDGVFAEARRDQRAAWLDDADAALAAVRDHLRRVDTP